MLVGGVVYHQFGNDTNAMGVRSSDKPLHVGHRAVVGMDVSIVADIIAVVQPGRRIEWQQPDRIDPEAGDVVEPRDQAGKIADPVVVRVKE